MRVEDDNGEWRVSEEDERLVIPRAPDEFGGTYYRIFREGTFKDYDGFERKIARPLYGLDMNCQYPYHWQAENEQKGAGPYPLSEPESRGRARPSSRDCPRTTPAGRSGSCGARDPSESRCAEGGQAQRGSTHSSTSARRF